MFSWMGWATPRTILIMEAPSGPPERDVWKDSPGDKTEECEMLPTQSVDSRYAG